MAKVNTLDNKYTALSIFKEFSGVKGSLNPSAIYCNTVSHFSLLFEMLSYKLGTIFPIFFFNDLSLHLIKAFITFALICSFISGWADFQQGLHSSPSETWISFLAMTAQYKRTEESVDEFKIWVKQRTKPILFFCINSINCDSFFLLSSLFGVNNPFITCSTNWHSLFICFNLLLDKIQK